MPIIKLENAKGLSLELARSLLSQLNAKADAEKGREIIHDLCVDVQEFLYLNNKPPSKSFFEQRLERRESEADDNRGDDNFGDDGKLKKAEDTQLVSSSCEIGRLV